MLTASGAKIYSRSVPASVFAWAEACFICIFKESFAAPSYEEIAQAKVITNRHHISTNIFPNTWVGGQLEPITC